MGFPFGTLGDAMRSSGGRQARVPTPSGRPGRLPAGVANTTLQTLSPEQLAALGVTAALGTGFYAGTYYDIAAQPGEELEGEQNNGDGTYGQSGVEYRARIYYDSALTRLAWQGYYQMYGPITPSVYASPTNDFRAWQFDGFSNLGDPLNQGGGSSSGDASWRDGITLPRFFKIYRADDPLEIEVEPNGLPVVDITRVPDLPLTPEQLKERERDRNIDRLKDGVANIGEELADLAELLADVVNTLNTKLACDPCQLLIENEVARRLDHEELNQLLEEVEERSRMQVSAQIPVQKCGEEEVLVPVEGTSVQTLADIVLTLGQVIVNTRDHLCGLGTLEFAIPEAWTDDKDPDAPQITLKLREAAQGHPGTPKIRSITLPYFVGSKTGPFPSWTRGNWKATARVNKNSELKIFASSEAQARGVIEALGAMCEGFIPSSVVVSKGTGWVTNEVVLSPYKVLVFSDGRRHGPQPDEIYNLETGESWTNNRG